MLYICSTSALHLIYISARVCSRLNFGPSCMCLCVQRRHRFACRPCIALPARTNHQSQQQSMAVPIVRSAAFACQGTVDPHAVVCVTRDGVPASVGNRTRALPGRSCAAMLRCGCRRFIMLSASRSRPRTSAWLLVCGGHHDDCVDGLPFRAAGRLVGRVVFAAQRRLRKRQLCLSARRVCLGLSPSVRCCKVSGSESPPSKAGPEALIHGMVHPRRMCRIAAGLLRCMQDPDGSLRR